MKRSLLIASLIAISITGISVASADSCTGRRDFCRADCMSKGNVNFCPQDCNNKRRDCLAGKPHCTWQHANGRVSKVSCS